MSDRFPTFWSHRYRGHSIQGRVTGNEEKITAVLHQPDGSSIRKQARSVQAAKSFITRYVRRER